MKEKGSFVLKELSTEAEEAARDKPPPPPAPPIPPPRETSITDKDLTGYSAAALLAVNGIITGLRGGYMIEAGILPASLCAWSAELHSKTPANAYFGTLVWGVTSLHYAVLHFTKRATYIPASLLCLTSLGMTGRHYYHQLQYEMKTAAEKDADNPW